MRHSKYFSKTLLLMTIAATLLSACGTTSNAAISSTTASTHAKPTTTTTTAAPTTTQPTTTTTVATTTTTTQPPTTTTTSITRCHASQLSLTYSVNGLLASQQESDLFRYTNTSNVTCTLYGYPGLAFIAADGQIINTTTLRQDASPAGFSPAGGPSLVTLAPLASGYFIVSFRVDNPIGSTTGCTVPMSVESYPPGSYSKLTITAQPGVTTVNVFTSGLCANLALNEHVFVTALGTYAAYNVQTLFPASSFASTSFVS